MGRWSVLVIWKDGDEEYLCEGLSDSPAKFASKARAEEQAEFMRMGMEDEVQSISVVRAPRERLRGTGASSQPEEA